MATRRQRENILRHVIESAGQTPYNRITPEIIVAGRERRSTPAKAKHFLSAMKGLFRWASEAKYVKNDPTSGVKAPPSIGLRQWARTGSDQ
jgi:site-specific recombinase XerD